MATPQFGGPVCKQIICVDLRAQKNLSSLACHHSVRTDRWRLVGKELYDLSNDPYEEVDVAAQHPEVVDRLSKKHFDWYETVIPYMIHLNNTWEKEQAPLETLYYKQEKERGIPEWMPAAI